MLGWMFSSHINVLEQLLSRVFHCFKFSEYSFFFSPFFAPLQVVESSGKGENNSTLPILSKNDKHESSESGGKVDAKIEDEKRHGTGTVLQQHTADVNAYKEGILKTMIDPS